MTFIRCYNNPVKTGICNNTANNSFSNTIEYTEL